MPYNSTTHCRPVVSKSSYELLKKIAQKNRRSYQVQLELIIEAAFKESNN